MDPALRRRLDALVLICSAILGIAVTYLFFSRQAGPLFLFYALLPTMVIALLADWYGRQGASAADGSRE